MPGATSAVQTGALSAYPAYALQCVSYSAPSAADVPFYGMLQDEEDDDAWLQEYKRELGVA